MKIFLPALVFFLTNPLISNLQAQDFSPCFSATLSVYAAPGFGECVLGNNTDGGLDVFGFRYISGPAGADSQIFLSPEPGPGGLGGGFGFSGFAAADPGTQVTYTIDYSYIIDPGPVASGMNLGMDPPFGNVLVTEYLCIDAGFTTSDSGEILCSFPGAPASSSFSPQSLAVTVSDPLASILLSPQVTQNDIANLRLTFVVGGAAGGGFDELSDAAVVTTAAVPEPVTSVLALSGLLSFVFFRRYHR
jgi:hypothetical protein